MWPDTKVKFFFNETGDPLVVIIVQDIGVFTYLVPVNGAVTKTIKSYNNLTEITCSRYKLRIIERLVDIPFVYYIIDKLDELKKELIKDYGRLQESNGSTVR